ncbi:MAG: right-handed parallel beta-helix repeat-containing protein [Nanoarchaeota archaeon]|nr:right-handed parallel beta-helix repeat-containing protein [Nanoarchaeota archaeon]
MKKILPIIIILFFIPVLVSATCVDLNDQTTWQGKVDEWAPTRYYVSDSITLCPGTYTHLTGGIFFGGMNDVIDCDGATLVGDGTGVAFYVGRGAGINVPYFARNTIRNCNIENYHSAITLNLAKECVVEDNTITNCKSAVKGTGAEGAIIQRNTMTNGGQFHGVSLKKSTNGYGSDNSIIQENTIEGFDQRGIELQQVTGTIITGNTITNSGQYGIYLSLSDTNEIYNNYFDNNNNIYISGSTGNSWNVAQTTEPNIIDGANIGGNSWSDYSGIGADCNGFGDTSYTTSGANDLFPLTEECVVVEGTEPSNPFVGEGPKVVEKPDVLQKDEETCKYLIEKLKLKDGKKFPSIFPYTEEVFNIHTMDKKIIGHISIEDKTLTSFGCDLKENSTYNIYLNDKKVIDNIIYAESPIDAFNKAKRGNLLKIKGETIPKRMKQGLLHLSLSFIGLFK